MRRAPTKEGDNPLMWGSQDVPGSTWIKDESGRSLCREGESPILGEMARHIGNMRCFSLKSEAAITMQKSLYWGSKLDPGKLNSSPEL